MCKVQRQLSWQYGKVLVSSLYLFTEHSLTINTSWYPVLYSAGLSTTYLAVFWLHLTWTVLGLVIFYSAELGMHNLFRVTASQGDLKYCQTILYTGGTNTGVADPYPVLWFVMEGGEIDPSPFLGLRGGDEETKMTDNYSPNNPFLMTQWRKEWREASSAFNIVISICSLLSTQLAYLKFWNFVPATCFKTWNFLGYLRPDLQLHALTLAWAFTACNCKLHNLRGRG